MPLRSAAMVSTGQCHRYNEYETSPSHWNGRNRRRRSAPCAGAATPARNDERCSYHGECHRPSRVGRRRREDECSQQDAIRDRATTARRRPAPAIGAGGPWRWRRAPRARAPTPGETVRSRPLSDCSRSGRSKPRTMRSPQRRARSRGGGAARGVARGPQRRGRSSGRPGRTALRPRATNSSAAPRVAAARRDSSYRSAAKCRLIRKTDAHRASPAVWLPLRGPSSTYEAITAAMITNVAAGRMRRTRRP